MKMKMSGRKGYGIVYALSLLLVLVGIFVLSGLAWTETAERGRAIARSFSVPVPRGFLVLRDPKNRQVEQLRSKGGLVLVQIEKPSFDNAFLASVVVVPAKIPRDFNLQDEAACAKIAKRTADSLRGPVQTAGIVQLSNGKHCQYTVRSQERANQGATGTIFSTPEEVLVVTCNYDIRDTAAISACTQVVNGWKPE
ncbi:MAG: hypothetical protein ACE5JQ_07165 [Candidatus Methylomirabilales bacterium]